MNRNTKRVLSTIKPLLSTISPALSLSLYMPGMKKKNRSTVPHTKSCGLTTNDCPTKGQYPEFGLYVPYIECSVKRRLYAFSVLTLCSGILRRTENHSTGVGESGVVLDLTGCVLKGGLGTVMGNQCRLGEIG